MLFVNRFLSLLGVFAAIIFILLGCEELDEQSGPPVGKSTDSQALEQKKDETIAKPGLGAEADREIEETDKIIEKEKPVYLPLEKNIIHHTAPLFQDPLDADLKEQFAVLAYYNEDAEIQLKSSTHEWVTVEGGHGTTYIPSWYWTEASAKSEVITPIRLIVDNEAPFHLYPESHSKWTYEELAQLSVANGRDLSFDPLVALFRYEEWCGVMFSPYPQYEDYILLRPVLLWLHESDIQMFGEKYDDLLSSEIELPIDTIREITEIMLHAGTRMETVIDLLGEPHLVELSHSLNYSGDPLRVGEDWRYELEEAHFIVTVFDEVVEEWEWILPLTEEEQLSVSAYQYPYINKYQFRPYPIVPSMESEMAWQNQGDLAYAYLWEATDDVLILRGDDGGFSGMHYDSNVYAVDRHTGEKLWQIDAGFAGVGAVVSSDKQYVTISTSYNPVKGEYEEHVRRMRLADGEIIWEQKFPERTYYQMAEARDVNVFYYQPEQNQKGEILVLDAASGNTLWEKTMEERFLIFNAKESYVIIQQGQSIHSLHPRTGELQWSIEIPGEGREGIRHMFFDRLLDPFNKERTSKWILIGNERFLVDLKTGKIEAKYTVTQNEYIFVVNDRYWLIHRGKDDTDYWQAENYETVLYDVIEERELWTLPGRGSGAVIENGTMYLMWDGVPTAMKLEDGSILWQMEYDHPEENPRYYFSGSLLLYDDYLLLGKQNDLLVIRKDSGVLEYRVQDVKYGYPDMYGNERVQMISRDEQYIYVGSNNGIFSKMKLKELTGSQ